MKKIYALALIMIMHHTLLAQNVTHSYSASIYDLSSKETYGVLTSVTDTTLTVHTRKNTERVFKYSELKSLKISAHKNTVQPMIWPMLIGTGFVLSSPFKSTFKSGLKTAGVGVGIVLLSAVIQVAITVKRAKKIAAFNDPAIKTILEPYVYKPSSDIGKH